MVKIANYLSLLWGFAKGWYECMYVVAVVVVVM